MTQQGSFYGIGVGIHRDTLTLEAVRLIKTCTVIFYAQSPSGSSRTYNIVREFLTPQHEKIPCPLPIHKSDQERIKIYQTYASHIKSHLLQGKNVAYLCVGDPALYSSYHYLKKELDALMDSYECRQIAGLSSFSFALSKMNCRLALGQDCVSFAPFVRWHKMMDRLKAGEGMVLFKTDDASWDEFRLALTQNNLLSFAYLAFEQGDDMIALPLAEYDKKSLPYFSLIFIKAQHARS